MVGGVGILFFHLWILAQGLLGNRRMFDFSLFHVDNSTEYWAQKLIIRFDFACLVAFRKYIIISVASRPKTRH